MSRSAWDDFGPPEGPGGDRPPEGEPHPSRHSGDELAQDLDHWIETFEEHMDSSIEEGWVHLRVELGELLNLLALMQAASNVLRARADEDTDDEREQEG